MKFLRALRISFFIFCCAACQQTDSANVSIRWKENKAIALVLESQGKESEESFAVRLSGKSENMLGAFVQEGNDLVFEPIVPFTRGLTYDVLKNNSLYASIEIPAAELKPVRVTGIYPSADTLPENLLKFYFEFSEPMQEDKSLEYIFLLNDQGDTLTNTFLELKPELWNTGGTLLTLWLDPGRIKRDLIPNKELGAPLVKGESYTLILSKEWKSKEGAALSSVVSKKFFVGTRDENSPKPARWVLTVPAKESVQPIAIDLTESLDYSLVKEAISVYAENELIPTRVELSTEERRVTIFPESPWKPGDYVLRIEARLEDLAGNNLNRPFDRDLSKGNKISEREFYELAFRIQ